MKENNIILEKSYKFAIRIVNLSKVLNEKNAFSLSNQIIKSGTSIGANIVEAQDAQSKKDFISKLSISLKEAEETDYWLRLLRDTEYISDDEFNSLISDCREIERLLTSIIKSVKNSL